MVAVGALATAMTAPGQTAGISILIEPIIATLGMSRSQVSTAYLVGTLVGATALPLIGRLLDRFGPRRVMTVVAAVFGAMLVGLSAATSVVGLTAGFVGIRMAGQGALSLTATTAVAVWVWHRRGFALGLTTAVGSAGISLAPVALEAVVAGAGWRTALLVEAAAVWLVVVPLAWFGLPRDRQAGQRGQTANRHDPDAWGWTLPQAVRTPAFWVITGGMACSAMLGTSINFHQISLLGEQGLSSTEAAANFLPQTVSGLLATLGAGALIDRVDPRPLVAGSMALLAGVMIGVQVVGPGWSAVVFGLALGATNGSIRAVGAAAFVRYFGTAHIGAIRGFVTSFSVAGSAFGPIALSLGRDAAGSYPPALLVLAAFPAAVVLASVFARPPGPQPVPARPAPDPAGP